MSDVKQLTDDERKLAEITSLQRDVDRAESEYEQANDDAKALKKIFEAKAKKLFEFIRALSKPLPLFEVWQQTPVTELGLPEGVVMLLQEAGVDTVGKIAAWTEGGKALTDLPHVGEAKAKAIEEALERFWKQRKAEGEVE